MKMNPPASSNSPTSRKKPRIIRHLLSSAPPTRRQPLPGQRGKFNLISTLSAFAAGLETLLPGLKALTLQDVASIRAPMAAGAIPPPQFFERRRLASVFAGREWHCQRRQYNNIASITRLGGRCEEPRAHERSIAAEGFLKDGQHDFRQEGDPQDCSPHHHQQVAPDPDARRGPIRRRGDQERRPRCSAEGDGARGTGTDAGSAAQYHSQE